MVKNHFVMIRTNPEEKERLKRLAEMEGASTLTNFCRQRLFQSLSVEIKLNKILEKLGEDRNKNGKNTRIS